MTWKLSAIPYPPFNRDRDHDRNRDRLMERTLAKHAKIAKVFSPFSLQAEHGGSPSPQFLIPNS